VQTQTAWPWLVDLLERLNVERPDLRLAELAERAREIAGTEPNGGVRCLFRREGEYWAVGRPGAVVRLRDSVGLYHLAELLSEPGHEFAAVDLVARRCGGRVVLGDAGEMLDARAKAEYRRRLEALQDEMEEAERLGDLGRLQNARAHVQALARELARAVGLGGRSRVAGSVAERARINVTRTIRDAMRRIGEQDVWVGHHFTATIRTGTFCCYSPDPGVPVQWTVSGHAR
jgi:hypothetical protein